MQLRIFFLALLLSASSIVAQQTGTTNQRLYNLETGFNRVQKDSIGAMISDSLDNYLSAQDTILSGTATIPLGADSVLIAHDPDLVVTIDDIMVVPNSNTDGYNWWVSEADLTHTTFMIRVGKTGYTARTELKFTWWLK